MLLHLGVWWSEAQWHPTHFPPPHQCPWVGTICYHLLVQLKWNIWALWGHKGNWKPMPKAIPVELEVLWWTSLTVSSPRRGSFYLTFPDPIQLSHFCWTHHIARHVQLSILIRPDPAGEPQGQVHNCMALQNLTAEVDQWLEAGKDHRANVKNLWSYSKCEISWIRVQSLSVQGLCTRSAWIHLHEVILE